MNDQENMNLNYLYMYMYIRPLPLITAHTHLELPFGYMEPGINLFSSNDVDVLLTLVVKEDLDIFTFHDGQQHFFVTISHRIV